MKTVHRHPAQRIGAADNSHVGEVGFNQPSPADNGPGAGGAGGGEGERRAVQRQPVAQKARRIAQLLLRILPAGAGPAVQRGSHVNIALVEAGGAGAEHHRDAVASEARDGLVDLGTDLG